jgi:hypothetical protein
MFDHDVRGEPDEALIAEGRARMKASAPNLTDAQFHEWLTSVRQRGGRLQLVLDGVIAIYDRGPT